MALISHDHGMVDSAASTEFDQTTRRSVRANRRQRQPALGPALCACSQEGRRLVRTVPPSASTRRVARVPAQGGGGLGVMPEETVDRHGKLGNDGPVPGVACRTSGIPPGLAATIPTRPGAGRCVFVWLCSVSRSSLCRWFDLGAKLAVHVQRHAGGVHTEDAGRRCRGPG